jgi:SAM-dependent methyltransferase
VGRRHVTLRELLLGFEGLALIRGLVDGADDEMQARVEEVRRIVESTEGPYSLGLDVPELDSRAGYALWSQTYDDIANPLIDAEQPAVEAITSRLPGGRALDAACGTGRHAAHMARSHSVTGVDTSPEMLTRARARVPEGRFLLGDLRAIPSPDATFDVVVCALALCHLPDLAAGVAEVARVARPGARLVLTDPHPVAGAVLSQAFFPTGAGGVAFVRNHPHLIGDYLGAFDVAGLRVIDCHEPLWAEDYLGGVGARYIPDAMKQALIGFPFAIVWELERSR